MTSQTAEYALRATIYLAEHPERTPYRVSDLARALAAPRNYLSKILHVLAREGVLTSARGPRGGFRLAVDPAALPLARIVGLFDPLPGSGRCLLGRARCSDGEACGVHERWKRVGGEVAEFFRATTVGDVLASARAAGRSASGVESTRAEGVGFPI
jgi:Rrf2 family protein